MVLGNAVNVIPEVLRGEPGGVGRKNGVQQGNQVETLGDMEKGGDVTESGDLGFERWRGLAGAFGAGHEVFDLAQVDGTDNFGFAANALSVAGVVVGVAVDELRS